jgi:hypothetical protein
MPVELEKLLRDAIANPESSRETLLAGEITVRMTVLLDDDLAEVWVAVCARTASEEVIGPRQTQVIFAAVEQLIPECESEPRCDWLNETIPFSVVVKYYLLPASAVRKLGTQDTTSR